jgi:hypothetical protein
MTFNTAIVIAIMTTIILLNINMIIFSGDLRYVYILMRPIICILY